jgi:mannose-6-phosphate isomerase-like protein (cupin superfamily)
VRSRAEIESGKRSQATFAFNCRLRYNAESSGAGEGIAWDSYSTALRGIQRRRWLLNSALTHVTAASPSGGIMSYQSINFARKFALFSELWQPKVIAEMNEYQFKVVKVKGDFVWHNHRETDETFIVIEGDLRIDFRDGAVHLSSGELFVVPKGVEHKPFAENEVKVLLIEPRGVLNTGDQRGERTAQNDTWI